jgi:hypothetical protein
MENNIENKEKSNKNLPAGCLVIIIIVVVAGWLVYPKGDSGMAIDAYLTTQVHVKKYLKAPATAQFPEYDKSFVKKINDTSFEVNAYVDSQNGFGALLRSTYLIRMHQDDKGNWLCDYFEFNGKQMQ